MRCVVKYRKWEGKINCKWKDDSLKDFQSRGHHEKIHRGQNQHIVLENGKSILGKISNCEKTKWSSLHAKEPGSTFNI